MDDLSFSGTGGIVVLIAYAVIMLGVGFLAGRDRESDGTTTARSYYVSGGSLGFITLLFTLYATQYSGNAIVGYAPEAYRSGFGWWQSVPFMTAVITCYLLFAPRLYAVSKRRSFVTPTDFVRARFGSSALCLLSSGLMLWGLGNYLLEQLVAMGHGIAGLTGETVPYQLGVVVFVGVMLAYSWSGGMRAVAMTDVMQGVALLVGIVVLLGGALYLTGGGLGSLTSYLAENAPETIGAPDNEYSVNWLSMTILIGLGAAVYPHAIQRVYAARTERTLKRSLAVMAWLPFATTAVVFLVGLTGLVLFPGLDVAESEQLVGRIANEVAAINVFTYVLMILLFGGVIAAIVSTADSALLAFSSIVSKDVYGQHIAPDAPEKQKVLVGKMAGIAAIGVLLALAWNPPTTLLSLFVLKFELIVQVAPVFMLGLYWRRMAARPAFWGMLVGALIAGGLTIADLTLVPGVPGGLIGLVANLVIVVVGSLLTPLDETVGEDVLGPARQPEGASR
ncbi:sodium:solute symporter family protein [Nocardioides euryhalodurans]|uniref:Sodium:solute symporter family protein n=1 Tax=Nocardioides euryhalodurans TaxID=2518370 RepID=A0A4P7GLA4_9ACTN|nr:sodium:solute symporter family protein [Nocardioides euryhalodurans]QBR92875.1 sodium:solute symporter family protein [Nocardioides euryhalodurans]